MAKKAMFLEVRASPETVFRLLIDDLTRKPERPSATSWQPLDEGPVRVGYTLENKRNHDGHTCRDRLRVTAFEPPDLIEHVVESKCAVLKSSVRLVRRYKLERHGINTKVTAAVQAPLKPLKRLIYFFVPSIWDGDLPRSLGYIKFESERREREGAPAIAPPPPVLEG